MGDVNMASVKAHFHNTHMCELPFLLSRLFLSSLALIFIFQGYCSHSHLRILDHDILFQESIFSTSYLRPKNWNTTTCCSKMKNL